MHIGKLYYVWRIESRIVMDLSVSLFTVMHVYISLSE